MWAFGKTVYQALLNVMLDPDYGDITDVYEGHDVKVTCTKQAGRQWAMTDVMPRPKSTPLGTKSEIKNWQDNIPELDDLYQLKSYEQLENIINAWLNGDDEANDTSMGYQNEAAKQPQKKTKTESFGDIDDAFKDLEGDLGY